MGRYSNVYKTSEEEDQHTVASGEQTLCMAFLQPLSDLENKWRWGNSKDAAAELPAGKALLRASERSSRLSPVWWRLQDGWVDFGSSWDRWWLKGLDIESLQCI